jgi:hypothetical protein
MAAAPHDGHVADNDSPQNGQKRELSADCSPQPWHTATTAGYKGLRASGWFHRPTLSTRLLRPVV